MGGLGFLLGIAISLTIGIIHLFLVGEPFYAISLILSLAYAVLNSFVGFIDDLKKLKTKKNAGLTPTEKLMLQAFLAALLLLSRYVILGDGGILRFSFGDVSLGFWYYPLAFIMLLGTVNCANLTDGIDGLASSVALTIGATIALISHSANADASLIGFALMGAAAAFLIFNLHPAKIFMGDTGSLLFGSLVASSGLILENPLLVAIIGGVYLIEGLSVIIQVSVYKLTKKRVFKMAPIHHHFEELGLSEKLICVIAVALTVILAVPTYLLYVK